MKKKTGFAAIHSGVPGECRLQGSLFAVQMVLKRPHDKKDLAEYVAAPGPDRAGSAVAEDQPAFMLSVSPQLRDSFLFTYPNLKRLPLELPM